MKRKYRTKGLASELERIEPRVVASPWPGHEHVRGYAVMALPFSSGHVLGLRVWPENDFAPTNVTPGVDAIHFAIRATGPATISLASELLRGTAQG